MLLNIFIEIGIATANHIVAQLVYAFIANKGYCVTKPVVHTAVLIIHPHIFHGIVNNVTAVFFTTQKAQGKKEEVFIVLPEELFK